MKFCPCEKVGGEKSFNHAEGGHKKCWGTVVARVSAGVQLSACFI